MTESIETSHVVKWFRLQYPQYVIGKDQSLLISIPNGQWVAGTGKRKFALVAKYKREGLTPGVSDLFLAVPKGKFSGLWIEMKDRNKTQCSLSPAQKIWINAMNNGGFKAVWCAGADEAMSQIKGYLNL